MPMKNALTLNNSDPRVIAARDAETRLFDFYGLKAKTHYISLPHLGIRFRVSEIGEGPPVLILPGNTGDVFPLAPLLAQLPGRRIIAINRPGGGLSEGMDHRIVNLRQFAVETISAVLDFFELESAPIIAHSIGGHMSLWMAMDHPDRVSALTLLGVPGNIMGSGPPFALRLLSVPVLNRLLFNLVSPKRPELSLRGLSFMGHPAETLAGLPYAMAECYYYFQKLPNYQVSALSLMERGNLWGASNEDQITAEQLRTVQQPVLFLWGDNDPFGSMALGQKIAGTVAHARFHAIKGGHLPWLDEPVQCGRLTVDFLSGY
jgi:2-hydroxy-6-oxonona-2,4-dienedioate hydrolase